MKKHFVGKQGRQGDILFEIVDRLPDGAKSTEKILDKALGRHLVALGEVTGHHHSVLATDFDIYEKDGTLYMRAKADCATAEPAIEHQEHEPLVFPKGETVKIVRQREHDYVQGIRQVMD